MTDPHYINTWDEDDHTLRIECWFAKSSLSQSWFRGFVNGLRVTECNNHDDVRTRIRDAIKRHPSYVAKCQEWRLKTTEPQYIHTWKENNCTLSIQGWFAQTGACRSWYQGYINGSFITENANHDFVRDLLRDETQLVKEASDDS